jgi:hypothetical protein
MDIYTPTELLLGFSVLWQLRLLSALEAKLRHHKHFDERVNRAELMICGHKVV